MPTMDVFNNDEFGLVSLTARVNELPFVPTRTRDLGLFETSSISTTTGFIDIKQGTVSLIGTSARGTDPANVAADTRNAVPVSAVRLAKNAHVTADEVQGVRAFGQESDLETVQGVLDQKLGTVVRDLDATLEWHRLGALKGVIYDADATTEVLNLYTALGIAAPTEVAMNLSGTGSVRKKISGIIRQMEDALGMSLEGVHAFCGPDFFDALVDNPEIKAAYERQADGEALRARTARRSVFYAGVTFEEYRGTVSGQPFVGATKAHFFPTGVPGLFQQVFAPGDRMEVVNTLGLPRYAFPYLDPKGRFQETELQSNPITYCTRPASLIPARMGA